MLLFSLCFVCLNLSSRVSFTLTWSVGLKNFESKLRKGQPQIILMKEGTDSSQGKPQLISNINACAAVVDAIRTTLGPRGMDKLIVDTKGQATISNDGATIMKQLDIVHPAAKILVDIAKSQDAEVGDGTTTVVLLAGQFLEQCKTLIEEGVHPHAIIRAFRRATNLAIEKINEIAVKVSTWLDGRIKVF
ncbi:uncharacterized protein [Cherax quadricarinatus]|uniref:uncharacterized protein isoform X1 n=1 Tax=Cherax quadricarinatus TaxID=27406 RepID=UPI00387EB888